MRERAGAPARALIGKAGFQALGRGFPTGAIDETTPLGVNDNAPVCRASRWTPARPNGWCGSARTVDRPYSRRHEARRRRYRADGGLGVGLTPFVRSRLLRLSSMAGAGFRLADRLILGI
jgi:hypothetical protein